MEISVCDRFSGKIIERYQAEDDQTPAQSTQFNYYAGVPADAIYVINGEPVSDADVIRAAKKAQINAIRDNEELQPFEYLGKLFDADEKAMKRLSLATQAAQAAILAGQSFSITWTCADNSTIDLDRTQMLGALEAMMRRGVELHEKARVLKALVDAATTAAEVGAIRWD